MKKSILILLFFLCGSNIFAQKRNEYYISATFAGKKILIIDKKNGYYINPTRVALIQQDENSNVFRGKVETSFDNKDNTKMDCVIKFKDLIFRQKQADSTTFHQNITRKIYPFTDDINHYGCVGAHIGITDRSTPDNFMWTTKIVCLEDQNAGIFKITKIVRKKPTADNPTYAIIEIAFDAILGRLELKNATTGEMRLLTRPFKGKARLILQM